MARGISKTEIKRLGCKYAEVLLYDPFVRPEAMPDLADNPIWRKLKQDTQNTIVYNIRSIARRQLLEAGYNPQTVTRVIGF